MRHDDDVIKAGITFTRATYPSVFRPCFGCTQMTNRVTAAKLSVDLEFRVQFCCDECFKLMKQLGMNNRKEQEEINRAVGGIQIVRG